MDAMIERLLIGNFWMVALGIGGLMNARTLFGAAALAVVGLWFAVYLVLYGRLAWSNR